MVYKAAIVYMNDVQFTTVQHEHGYYFGASYKLLIYKAAIVYMNDVQFTTLKHEHDGYFFGVF